MSIVEEGLRKLGERVDPSSLTAFERYIDELLLWNSRINLFHVPNDRNPRETAQEHILDSAAGASVFRGLSPETIVDVGSGAGFPGIVLAFLLPESSVTLLERSPRKSAFLRNVQALLSPSGFCKNVHIITSTLEELTARQPVPQFDVVTARAFRDLPGFVNKLAACTRDGGYLILYKGKKSTIEKEMTIVETSLSTEQFGAMRWDVIPLSVPFLEAERHLVTMRMGR